MLRHTFKVALQKNPVVQQICWQSTQPRSAHKAKWDLLVGVQLERLPVITKSLNKLQKEYQEFLSQVEFERSYKSDFEIQSQKDQQLAELIKKGEMEVDLDASTKQTNQDLEDLWKEERSKLPLASRTTEADNKNDLKSTNRRLEDALTLITEQKFGKEKIFLLPQSRIQPDETLRETAERIIQQTCGSTVQAVIYGNAPCGFYKYKYPSTQRNDAIGAKVFFYRAVLKSGHIDNKSLNFKWLNKDELLKKVDKYEEYTKSLKQFVI